MCVLFAVIQVMMSLLVVKVLGLFFFFTFLGSLVEGIKMFKELIENARFFLNHKI